MENYTNLTELIYEPLVAPSYKTHTFGYAMYGEFKLIVRGDGYVNATKLCTMGGKDYFEWDRLVGSKRYVSYLEKRLVPGKGQGLTDAIPINGTNPMDMIVVGTYVHPKLITRIAQWVSDEFSYMVSEIVENYLVAQHKAQIRALERKNSQQADKIDELMAKMDAIQREQNAKLDMITNLASEQLDEIFSNRVQLNEVLENNEELKEQNIQIINTLNIASETRVPDDADDTREFLTVFVLDPPVGEFTHYVTCGKRERIRQSITLYGEPIFELVSPNPKELYKRIGKTPGIMTSKSSHVRPHTSIESFIESIKTINNEKYIVKPPRTDPYKSFSVEALRKICSDRKIKGRGRPGLKRAGFIALIEANGGL